MDIRSTTARTITAGAAALVCVALLAACSDSDDATSEGHDGHGSTASTSAPSGGQEQSAHNDADVMFAQMMIPHHLQAVQMSEVLLGKDGVPDDVRELAESIKAAQAPEVQQLTGWLSEWGAPVEADMGGHHMDGMVSEADLAKLTNAPGEDAARLYLQQMIGHHEGAVTMAQTEIDDGRNPDAVAMARSIVETQNKEIDAMKRMLG